MRKISRKNDSLAKPQFPEEEEKYSDGLQSFKPIKAGEKRFKNKGRSQAAPALLNVLYSINLSAVTQLCLALFVQE